jgi:hypothetical protein
MDGASRQPGRPTLPRMRCGSAGPGGSVGGTSSELAISIALVAWVCQLEESHVCPWARGARLLDGKGKVFVEQRRRTALEVREENRARSNG